MAVQMDWMKAAVMGSQKVAMSDHTKVEHLAASKESRTAGMRVVLTGHQKAAGMAAHWVAMKVGS